jgi:hypothetical protein
VASAAEDKIRRSDSYWVPTVRERLKGLEDDYPRTSNASLADDKEGRKEGESDKDGILSDSHLALDF